VNVDYVLAFARAAKAAQAQRFVVLSCVGADAGSAKAPLRVKGEMEHGLAALGFASLDILQPGPLLGLRRHVRPLDLALLAGMPLINPLLFGPREIHRGVSAQTIGAAMVGATRSGRRGVQRYTYSGIQALVKLKAPRIIPLAPSKASSGAK
jgi:uncharacterized protein YbjT (DUF2867 family)